MQSSTVWVSMPGVSKLLLSGTIPSVDHLFFVVFSPTFPVTEAGILTEPAVSVPNARAAVPVHKLTPAPELEPCLLYTSPSPRD